MPLIMNSALINGWREVSAAVNASLAASLVQLVEIRASQINGCANTSSRSGSVSLPIERRGGRLADA
jgi:hypothetical protein